MGTTLTGVLFVLCVRFAILVREFRPLRILDHRRPRRSLGPLRGLLGRHTFRLLRFFIPIRPRRLMIVTKR